MSNPHSEKRNSTDILLSLVVGDTVCGLSQVAPEFVLLAEPISLLPSHAEVHVNVDGHVHSRSVFLVDGCKPPQLHVRISASAVE